MPCGKMAKEKDSQPAIDQISTSSALNCLKETLSFLKRKTGSLLRSNTMPVSPNPRVDKDVPGKGYTHGASILRALSDQLFTTH